MYTMNPFPQGATVSLATVFRGPVSLFGADEAAPAEPVILESLERLGAGGLVVIDFDGVRVSSEAARQLLGRAIRRITSGELSDRFVILWQLGASSYNTKVMLEGEGLTTVERLATSPGARLLGRFEPAVRETFDFVLSTESTTAGEVKEALGLESTAAATNRLTRLAKLALVRRIAERAIAGGGREFVYSAVR